MCSLFHLQATLKLIKPQVFVTLTPLIEKETPSSKPRLFNSIKIFLFYHKTLQALHTKLFSLFRRPLSVNAGGWY